MVINDKALASTLKRCGKPGFRLWASGGQIIFCCNDFYARVDLRGAVDEERPRLTLAALVEMLGYIPEDEILDVCKRDGEYRAEPFMLPAFESETVRWALSDAVKVWATPMLWRGMRVFQSEARALCLVRPDIAWIGSGARDAEWDGSLLRTSGAASEFICAAGGGAGPVYDALASVELRSAFLFTDGADSHADELDGQTEMEAGNE